MPVLLRKDEVSLRNNRPSPCSVPANGIQRSVNEGDLMNLYPCSDEDQTSGNSAAFAATLVSVVVFLIVLPLLWLFGFSFLGSLGLSILVQTVSFALLVFLFSSNWKSSDVVKTSLVERSESATSSVDEGLWSSFLKRENESIIGRIGFAACMDPHVKDMASDLSDAGYEVHVTSDSDALMHSIEESPFSWMMMILDLDLYDDIAVAIEDLLVFRSVSPETIVVVLSSDVSRDDVSLERAVVADVTLRKPVRRNRLLEGVRIARNNAMLRNQKAASISGAFT